MDFMGPVLFSPYLEAISRLCQHLGVARLELFGSAASGEFQPGISDFDFLYELDAAATGSQAQRLLDFACSMEALLGTKVDLVNPRYIRNPYFKAEVDRTRVPVYPVHESSFDPQNLHPTWDSEIEHRLNEYAHGKSQAINAGAVFTRARSIAK